MNLNFSFFLKSFIYYINLFTLILIVFKKIFIIFFFLFFIELPEEEEIRNDKNILILK